jgi:hypothetical protein
MIASFFPWMAKLGIDSRQPAHYHENAHSNAQRELKQ